MILSVFVVKLSSFCTLLLHVRIISTNTRFPCNLDPKGDEQIFLEVKLSSICTLLLHVTFISTNTRFPCNLVEDTSRVLGGQ